MEYKPMRMCFLVFILANITIYNHPIFLVIIYVVIVDILRESSHSPSNGLCCVTSFELSTWRTAFFLFDQIVQKRQQFSFHGLYELRLSSNWMVKLMVCNGFLHRLHVVCRRVDERRVRLCVDRTNSLAFVHLALMRFSWGDVVFFKNVQKTAFRRSVWRMTVPLHKVSAGNVTTDEWGTHRWVSGT